MLASNLFRTALFLCLNLLLGRYAFAQTSTISKSVNPKETYITSLLAKIQENGNTVKELSEANLKNLPVGVKRTINNKEIVIGIDSALAAPGGIMINAYTQLKLNGETKRISFEVRHLLITPAGIASSQSSKMALISDIEIAISEQVHLILPGDGDNYIEWDCNGFKSVNLKGLFKFSGDVFIPDPELSKDQKEVTASFEVNAADPDDIVASVSITPFRISGLGDMAFEVKNAAVDMSDYANCEGFVFPATYKNDFKDQPALWRGFFLKELKVYLPSELSGNKGRTEIDVRNMLIDESGVSGSFSVSPVLGFGDGDASGWPFSVDKIGVTITQNNLTAGVINGKLGVPFLNNDTLGYGAQFQSTKKGLEYNFSVTTNVSRTYNFPFGGGIQLNKSCTINVELLNGKFVPSAMLNGVILLENDAVTAKGIRFEKLLLTTESPYLLGGKFAVASSAGFKIQNFSFCIDSIALGIMDDKATLEFNVIVALMSSSDKGIAACTSFEVNASVERKVDPVTKVKGKQEWKYGGVRIKSMDINCELSIFALKGELSYKNDEVYGNGFHGEVEFTIKKIVPQPVSAEIYFGTKDDFKYWFVKVSVPVKIQIGTVTLLRITGGAYDHMKRKDQISANPAYVPDKNCGIGFIAGVGLAVASDKLIYADVQLEIAFNTSGGLRFIRFDGSGTIFSGPVDDGGKSDNPDEPKAKATAPVKVIISMLFDNENDVFHANLKVYLNIAGILTGTGPDNLLGECVIHSDPHDWYIYIGRPSQMLGLNVLGLAKVQTYFMAGTKLEDMPLPPNEVASILGNIDLNFMKKENALKTGGGVAFGMRFNMGFGFGKDGGFVYAYFDVGAGGDIILHSYGDAECISRSGSIGIDGWYASGQAYTYLQGRLGIRVKHEDFDIMSVATALMMQAKGPNPTWFKGNMTARYRILGGLVKGSVHLTVTLGEECIVLTNAGELNDIKLIGDFKPVQGSSDVDVFTAPQVAFNTAIEKEFSMMNLADEMNVYRLKLDDFKLTTADNLTITNTLEWNAEHDVAMMKMASILPGKQNMSASVKVHIEKKTSGGWEPLKFHDNIIYEDTTCHFVTGEEPTTVPDNNVAYSYPVKNQYNFYHNEYAKGYIKLNLGQPNLFRTQSDGKTWAFKVKFKNPHGNVVEAPASYDESGAMINFEIPGNLSTSETYTMDIIKTPILNGGVDSNLERGDKTIASGTPGDSTKVASNKLQGTIAAKGEKSLHSFAFRSSLYSTFNEKLNNFKGWRAGYTVDQTLMSLLDIEASMSETFDRFELSGGTDFAPLVYAEAEMGNPWLSNHVNPIVYELYNSDPGITLDRDLDKLGLFPLKAMPIINFGEDGYTLQTGHYAAAKSGDIAIRYFIPHYVYTDFSELRNKAATLYLGKSSIPAYAQRLLAGSIDDIYRGQYPFRINYRLPGLNTITTSKEFKIVY